MHVFLVQHALNACTFTFHGARIFCRWDWYDPYRPPKDYDVRQEAGVVAAESYWPVSPSETAPLMPSMDPSLGEVDHEYFGDMGFVMSGTQVRPDMKNVQLYSWAQKTKNTPVELVRQGRHANLDTRIRLFNFGS